MARAIRAEKHHAVGAGSEPRTSFVGVIQDDPVEVLALQLAACVGLAVPGFQCKPDEHLPVLLALAKGREDIRRAPELQNQILIRLLRLLLAGRCRCIVGDGRGRDYQVGVRMVECGSVQVVRADDIFPVDSSRSGQINRPSEEHYVGASPCRSVREGKAHRARRSVRQKSYRVDGFARWPGSDEDFLSFQ